MCEPSKETIYTIKKIDTQILDIDENTKAEEDAKSVDLSHGSNNDKYQVQEINEPIEDHLEQEDAVDTVDDSVIQQSEVE